MHVRFSVGLFVLCFSFVLWQGTPAFAALKAVDGLVPNGTDFLPPPPAEDSATFLRDKEVHQQTRSLKGSARWDLAIDDAELNLEGKTATWFLDSFGLKITKAETPSLYDLLWLVNSYVHKADKGAKAKYQRVRPFVYYKEQGQTCTPKYEAFLATNGSYPSGHTSRAWVMALLLAEISPERQGAILARGYDIGQSRVVCGVHWQSDVDAGRLVASAVVVQMHNDPQAMALLHKAKEEVQKVREGSAGLGAGAGTEHK